MDLEDLLKAGSEGGNTNKKKKISPLESLKTDLDFYKESIKEVSTELVAEKYTQFPIFVAHQHEVSVGEVILDRTELGTEWTIQVSSLEEFLEVGIVKEDKKEKFIQKFKDPAKYMCLFVVVPEGANFVFYPFEKD